MFTESKKRKLFIKRAKKTLPPIVSKSVIDTCGLYIRSPMAYPRKKEGVMLFDDGRLCKDIETSTDFPFPDIPLRKYKFKLKEDEGKRIIPTSLTPALPSYTNSSPKLRQGLSPLLPRSFQNYSLKSVSPVNLFADFDLGRSKSSSKDTLKVYIQKMKTLKTPQARSLKPEIRQKYFENIHLRSVLNKINS